MPTGTAQISPSNWRYSHYGRRVHRIVCLLRAYLDQPGFENGFGEVFMHLMSQYGWWLYRAGISPDVRNEPHCTQSYPTIAYASMSSLCQVALGFNVGFDYRGSSCRIYKCMSLSDLAVYVSVRVIAALSVVILTMEAHYRVRFLWREV